MASAVWLYFFCKIIELLDTVSQNRSPSRAFRSNLNIPGLLRAEEEDEPGVLPARLPPLHDADLRVDRREIPAGRPRDPLGADQLVHTRRDVQLLPHILDGARVPEVPLVEEAPDRHADGNPPSPPLKIVDSPSFCFQIQFCIIFVHNAQVMFRQCDYPKFINVLLGTQALFFLYLFGSFYYRTYIKGDSRRRKEAENNNVNGKLKSS